MALMEVKAWEEDVVIPTAVLWAWTILPPPI